jgi:xylulokinase
VSWLGLDLGTSSLKAAVVDDDGRLLVRARAAYPLRSDGPIAEQDPADYDAALAAVLADCREHLPGVEGVGVVGQTPSLVLAGADGTPVAPAITWRDARSAAEAAELAERFGDRAPELVGMALPWSPSFPPARLLWLRRHAPDVASRVRWILQPKDHLVARLTGEIASDPWSSKGLCDVRTHQPARELLEALGWGAEVVPAIAPAWAAAGSVRPGAAVHGLRPGTPVSVGWSDALGGMLAVGAFDAPSTFVISGTSDIAGMSAGAEPADARGLLSVPATCAPRPVLYGPTQSSGASVKWWSDLLGLEADELVALAGAAEPCPEPPIFAPYIAGERAPLWDERVRGAFLGLDAAHDRRAVARGVLLGVALSGRHVIETAAAGLGRPAGEALLAGRDALDPTWRAIRRTVLGVATHGLSNPDPSCLGAAMLGALAAGRPFADLASLRGALTTDAPDAADRAASDRLFARYLAAGDAAIAFSRIPMAVP